MWRKLFKAIPLAVVLSLMATAVYAQDGGGAETAYVIDNMFLFICAVLVLFMQAGFAMVEAGFNSAKNTINILAKNVMDMGFGVMIFWLIGYGIMYGDAIIEGWFAYGGIGISSEAPAAEAGALNPQVDWMFQVAFAATAATIVSGAVAGRMKFAGYIVYSLIVTGLIYPISGYWKWGGGWLDALGFYDFAGSLVVHAVGGFVGLAGAIMLGPRIGRFTKSGENKLPPHNLSMATLGVFILWVGWYGFNPGSQLAISSAADTNAVMLIAANTTLAAAAGLVAAMIMAWLIVGKPDLSYALNGALAGLVGITANCDSVTNISAIVIGLVAGVLVIYGMRMLEALKIDDPVGAWPVHGLCGIWGGIATGLFGGAAGHTLMPQIIGSLAIPAWAFVTGLVMFGILRVVGLLRVSPEEEEIGLDVTEHGASAYGEAFATYSASAD